MEERLQKILARAGIGSRRQCDEYITEGRVKVNGVTATIGSKADPEKDRITFDGRKLDQPEPLQYIALYKPRNVISTVSSPDPRPTVIDLIPSGTRLFPVGRLDIESEGLILLTNDGELANRITHPRYGCEKEYRVLVPRVPDEKQLKAWQSGVVLEDGYRTAPAKVKVESESTRGIWLRIIMHEGRKRQIREVGERLGLPVLRLIRIRIGSLHIAKMKAKEWRYLAEDEVKDLRAAASPDNKNKRLKSRPPVRTPGRPKR